MIFLFLVLAFVAPATYARVDFAHSSILDEYDFKGQGTVTVNNLCRITCHIYASITEDSRKLANNLIIQTGKGFKSISAIADLRDLSTNRKMFLEINNTASLSIMNGNSGNSAGSLVLYVVSRTAEAFDAAEVYEAEGLDRKPKWAQAITVMSARPFTLKEANYTALVTVMARLTGFDARAEECSTVYYLNRDPFPGFTMTVNSPIITLFYAVQQNHFPTGELTTTMNIGDSFSMEPSGFVNSPGFHGCVGKSLYRSSLYDFSAPILRRFHSISGQEVSLSVIVHSDEAHPVSVLDVETNKGIILYETHDETYVDTLVGASIFEVSWNPVNNGYFLVKYDSTVRYIIDN